MNKTLTSSLKRYDTKSCRKVFVTKRILSVASRHSFRIAGIIADEMGIKTGSKVVMFQDATNPKLWYLAPNQLDGFVINKNHDTSLRFSNSDLAQKFLASFEWTRPSVQIPVGDKVQIEGMDLWPIETEKARYTGKEKD